MWKFVLQKYLSSLTARQEEKKGGSDEDPPLYNDILSFQQKYHVKRKSWKVSEHKKQLKRIEKK